MDIIKEFLQINFPTFILTVFLVMAAIIAGYKIIGEFSKLIGKPVKWVKKKEEDHELLMKAIRDLDLLDKKHDKDVKASINHDHKIECDLTNFMEEIRSGMKQLANKFDVMKESTDERFSNNEEKENKRVQSEIKERIAQSYREYHRTQQISSIELEALEDLIETYEAHGGENSFVHSLVQKEMYTWEVK
jgi:ATP-dependent Lon protease